MTTKFKGIIFDLDGVICSTDLFHTLAWKKMAESEGLSFDEKIADRLKGVSRAESLEIVLENAGAIYPSEKKAQLMEMKNNMYKEYLKEMSPADLTDEVRDTLYALHDKGIRLAIGSSSKNAKFILERIGLLDFFDKISDGTNIQRSKPDPQVFLMAAEMLGLDPSDCLVVEDAEAGIDAAVAGGFHSAGISSARDYEKAEYHLASFSELLSIAG